MKHHNNLSDDQIHLPKGFQTANNRSILTRNSSGGLIWNKCNYTSSVSATPIDDIGGGLHHSYFSIYSSNNANTYAVYFDVTSTESFTLPTGYTGSILVDCTSVGIGITAAQIATQLQIDLDAHADFTATESSGVVTITGMATATDAIDVSTSFTINVTQTKDVNEVLTTDSSGNIAWNSQTNLFSDTIEFQGYGALSTNYYILKGFENNADGKFGTDFGSADNTDTISPQNALRSGRFIAARDYTLNRWTGVVSNLPSDVCTIELWKVTPADNSSTALAITVLKATTITGAGNLVTRTFDLDLTGEANRTITKGDIVLCAVKNDDSSTTFYLNSSLRLEYKI
mgnify:CR=1 FL=1|tara:strand:+ start:8564 stop:9592 length:1029 start_codon:yes stop_codon:yes gene_type:complete